MCSPARTTWAASTDHRRPPHHAGPGARRRSGFCDDLAVNGAPFYVMGFVDGTRHPGPCDGRGAAHAGAPGERAGVSLVETLAAIHAVDVDAVGLGDLGRKEGYLARQLKRWYGQWNAQKTRELPAVDRVHDVLVERIPEQRGASVVHGDYRLDNCMVDDDGNVIAVLDWEICTLGDPLADVGLLLVYHTGPDDEPTRVDQPGHDRAGFPNRAELVERYAAVSGRDVSDIDVYVAFAFWKLACILEGVYARYLGGALGQRDPVELEPFKTQVDQAAAQALAYVERLG